MIGNQLSDLKDLMSHSKKDEDNDLNEKSLMMVANSVKDDAPNNKKIKNSSEQEKRLDKHVGNN